ncbi:MAG: energy transducer TonB [Bdellovibrionota bacterium]
MLSTQRFAYATYFNRMKRAIQVYWHPPVSLIDHNRNKKTWISTMLIILNAQGELVEQQIISSSGAGPLDDYALQAVAKAAPFYNPPEVLLDDAKQIRMNWSFIFEASRF